MIVEATAEGFFQRGPALCSVVGFDGYLKLVNPGFMRLLGWSKDELLGNSYLDFVHPEDAQLAQGAFAAALVGRDAQLSLRARNVDGSYLWTEWTSCTDVQGRLIYAIGTETTQRRGRETAAGHESDARLRLLLDRSPLGIAIAAGDERILEVNDALCDLLGYSRDELTGRELSSVISDADRPRHLTALRKMVAGAGSTYEALEGFRGADGRPGQARLQVDLVRDTAGSPLYFISHWRPAGERAGPAASPSGPSPTPRELDVLRLAAQGLSTEKMAARLEVSPTTVKTHLKNLYAKLGVSNRAGAVAEALRHKLI